jgi:hypothetical protein
MASIVGYLVKLLPDRDSLGDTGYDADGVPSGRVQINRQSLADVGGVIYRPGQDWQLTLQVLAVGPDGIETPVVWPETAAAQLTLTDPITGELVLRRSTGTSELELTDSPAGGVVITFGDSEGPFTAGVHTMEIVLSASSFIEPTLSGSFELGRPRVAGGDSFPAEE